jgi:hypothetical protein
MDRAAPSPSEPDIVPPVAQETVQKVGVAAVGLVAAAAAAGLAADALTGPVATVVSSVRVWLVVVGVIGAGVAISLRFDLWKTWAFGAATALLAVPGLPAHWDSFRFFFTIVAGLAAFGAALRAVSAAWRLRAVTVVLLFHFFGIFTAATAPTPTSWVNEQLFSRVYNPYLQFIYLRNAYHFYSPDPGPASLICCLMRTETGEKVLSDGTKVPTYEFKWIVLPKRPADVKDPLGVAYYRRLALSEHIARGTPGASLPESFEKGEMMTRRRESPIPLHPVELIPYQYKLPHPDLLRYVIPSYAQHVILDHTPDAATAAKTTLKIYRLEHRTLAVNDFRTGNNPYHPATYRAYFLGEFNVNGDLLDAQERLLYWVVPVIAKGGPGAPPDPKQKNYIDYLSAHALGVRVEDLDKPENAANALDWKQLR